MKKYKLKRNINSTNYKYSNNNNNCCLYKNRIKF